jgi:protein gp37
MADGTKIEWTDATWNPVTGCSVVSPGCTNCYAMKLAGTRLKHHSSRAGLTIDSAAGPVWNGKLSINWQWFDQPLSWKRQRLIFVCAHGDLFHDGVDRDTIAQIYGVMIAAHHLRGHQFQVLTKRIDRACVLLNDAEFWDIANAHAGMHIMARVDPLDRRSDDARATCDDYDRSNPPPGIWIGTSVEDQARADQRVPHLLATPASVRFVSCEPLLSSVNLRSVKAPREPDEPEDDLAIDWRFDALEIGDYYWFEGEDGQPGDCSDGPNRDHRIDWVIAGGESGLGARPCHANWIRSLRDQCAAATLHGDDAAVPFFFKQWGEWAPDDGEGGLSKLDKAIGAKALTWADGRWHKLPQLISERSPNGDYDVYRFGKKRAGRLLDGVEHDGMPT